MLAPEIADYEPASALFAGGDGLDVIRAPRGLAPGRTCASSRSSSAPSRAARSRLLLATGRFRRGARPLRDLAGHERVMVGRR